MTNRIFWSLATSSTRTSVGTNKTLKKKSIIYWKTNYYNNITVVGWNLKISSKYLFLILDVCVPAKTSLYASRGWSSSECFIARTFFIRPVSAFSGLSFFYPEKKTLLYLYKYVYYNRKYTTTTTTTNASRITLAYICYDSHVEYRNTL